MPTHSSGWLDSFLHLLACLVIKHPSLQHRSEEMNRLCFESRVNAYPCLISRGIYILYKRNHTLGIFVSLYKSIISFKVDFYRHLFCILLKKNSTWIYKLLFSVLALARGMLLEHNCFATDGDMLKPQKFGTLSQMPQMLPDFIGREWECGTQKGCFRYAGLL